MLPFNQRRRKSLNLRLAGILVVVGIVLWVGLVTLHDIQVNNSAPRVLADAERAAGEGKYDDAIRFYRHYVHDRPNDTEAYCKMALLEAIQVKAAHYPPGDVARVFPHLVLALGRDPHNTDLLTHLAEMAMESGRLNQAVESFSQLVAAYPDDISLRQKHAACLMATADYRHAVEAFQEIIARSPTTVTAYVSLADMYRYRLNQLPQAETIIEQMVRANPSSSEARLERARFRWQIGSRSEVMGDLQTALQHTPDDANVLFFAAEVETELGQFPLAQKHIDRARQLYPQDSRVEWGMIYIKAAKGETEQALAMAERFVQKQPENSRALLMLADLQLQRSDLPGVRATIKQLARARFNRYLIDLVESQALMAEQKWRDASSLLEKLRVHLQPSRDLARRVELYLGMCYEKLGLPDRQKEAFERLLQMNPMELQARLGLASALSQTRQSDRALEEYSRLMKLIGVAAFAGSPSLRNHYYQLRSAQIMGMPENQRDWSELEEYVAELDKIPQVGPVDTLLMRTDLLLRQHKVQEAANLLAAAEDKFPKEPRVLNAIAAMVAPKNPQRAIEILARGQDAAGDSVDLRLVRANLALRIGRQGGMQILAPLEEKTEKFSDSERKQLWRGLGNVYLQLGEWMQAVRLWRHVIAADPDDLQIRMTLFDLGQQTGDEGVMREAMDSLAKTQGVQTAEWKYCQASFLLWQVRNGRVDRQWLSAAQKYLQQARNQRPTWELIPCAEAQIAIIEGRLEDAVNSFRLAEGLAPLPPSAQGQFVRLLFVTGHYSAARESLNKLAQLDQSAAVKMLGAELEFQAAHVDAALEMAGSVIVGSSNPVDYLWYGEILARAGKAAEAEGEFRKAVRLGRMIPEAWLALVAQLAANGKTAEARELLRSAEVYLPEDQAPLILAQAYEALGESGLAHDFYLAAAAIHAEDFDITRRVAKFLVERNRPDEAAGYLVRLIRLGANDDQAHPTVAWARRVLADMLTANGGFADQEQALELLNANAIDGRLALEDLRMKVAIYASRPWRQSQLNAIDTLEQIHKDSPKLDPDERLQLAQLYEAVGRWDLCQSQMQVLLRDQPAKARYLAIYLQMLLTHNAPADDLDPCLKKLEAAAPDADSTRSLKAKCLAKKGQPAKAVALLKAALPPPTPPAPPNPLGKAAAALLQVSLLHNAPVAQTMDLWMQSLARPAADKEDRQLLATAQTLEEMQQFGPAQELLAARAASAPAGRLSLAAFLARRGKLSEALDQCATAMKLLPRPEVVAAAVKALEDTPQKPRPEDYARVRAWLDEWQRAGDDSLSQLLHRARFLERQEKYAELIGVYRQLVARSDVAEQQRAQLASRLAYVMVFQKESSRGALEFIDQAIQILGPLPSLQDTRGLALLAAGRSGDAIDMLAQSIEQDPTGMRYFHLALAQLEANNLPAASQSLDRAREDRQFKPDAIPPLERPKYRDLIDKLSTL